MTRTATALLALLCLAGPAGAHQIWIEQPDGQDAVVRFGEFGENLREASPGPLDKFGKPAGTLLSANSERTSDAAKSAGGFTLPFRAAAGDSILAEDAHYPLYNWKQGDKDTVNRFYPAARLITGFSEQQPRLALDLVPVGQQGRFKLVFKGQPRPKTKVTLVTQSGWSKEGHTDELGQVAFDMPWQGAYVAEVSINERSPGQRAGLNGPETFEATSYVTTLTYFHPDGLAPIPTATPATPSK